MSPERNTSPAPAQAGAHTPRRGLPLALAACLLALAPLSGCRQNMHNQAKVKTFRESDFFADGQSARPLPAHTVARGQLRDDAVYWTGIGADGQPVTAPPMPVTREVLLRGEERFNVYCTPCHGRLGDGRGMVVQRGFKQPTSFHDERLRHAPIGYFFNNMTEGFGQMPSYAAQIPPADRWAIAAYVRVLQYAENARLADLSPEERQRLDAAWKKLAAPAGERAEPAEGEGERP